MAPQKCTKLLIATFLKLQAQFHFKIFSGLKSTNDNTQMWPLIPVIHLFLGFWTPGLYVVEKCSKVCMNHGFKFLGSGGWKFVIPKRFHPTYHSCSLHPTGTSFNGCCKILSIYHNSFQEQWHIYFRYLLYTNIQIDLRVYFVYKY